MGRGPLCLRTRASDRCCPRTRSGAPQPHRGAALPGRRVLTDSAITRPHQAQDRSNTARLDTEGHFRSDPSYLPELKSYLQQLLADREQIRSATDLQEWAKDRLAPREEEITGLRELIRRIEADLDDLTAEDQAQITEAITVIRKTRQVVNLGMPSVRAAGAEAG
jgi:chromosome segregation ATPase